MAGLLFGLLVAVLVGVLATLYLVLHELGNVGLTELQRTAGGDDVAPVAEDSSPVAGVLIVRIDAPLYTANVRRATSRILDAVDVRRLADGGEEPLTLVLDMSAVPMLTVTVIDELAGLVRSLAERRTVLRLAGLPPRARATVEQMAPWPDFAAEHDVFLTSLEAVRFFVAEQARTEAIAPRDP